MAVAFLLFDTTEMFRLANRRNLWNQLLLLIEVEEYDIKIEGKSCLCPEFSACLREGEIIIIITLSCLNAVVDESWHANDSAIAYVFLSR